MIKRPSLYDILLGNFSGGLPLHAVGENTQVILSVLDNMQRILNTRAGSLKHLPDYGLPDMTKILQGMPGNGTSTYQYAFRFC
jgi:type VI secretion system protein